MNNFVIIENTPKWAVSSFAYAYCYSMQNDKISFFCNPITKYKGKNFTSKFTKFLQENNVSENEIYKSDYLDIVDIKELICRFRKGTIELEKFELRKTTYEKILSQYNLSIKNEKTN